ncbi:UDP-N-acetylmuramoyl-tripeptide--D-alanyl-D-alanine ligase [Devosia sp. XJ19-1]|uniref:UDP-N-acetylmuramoyl-tripeptide--D-alanyl-D-alanine ligase n=1 Tax=Devosia ureilytica TaxID=2952754 RepID=A0A9Q4APB4_9HYPH|nr:UDP-N-acetylmuramoyl-tripeptide--D-alanyl-D-alanine ligase [Devosia ureilytica]MCP8883643.1 UDP-N-acetylmuramoyl-tripeptide--D-alanyl-D-alanine ligase [Devosia ureilytica]MCP8887251.1 UDP-N-acetylmuramoyl-tripeptide--D-alanyl-D-alanine ligase [Devosia ureilytica]
MTQPLFTLDAILAATGGRAEGVSATTINSISIDSRELGPDALFVAIKGDRFDGHDFVDTALGNGAVAALVSEGRGTGDGRIVVADALEGLRDLAAAARQRSRAFVVGVTGSVGKTTTKEALRLVFEAAGETHASIKSFNNHWGVPLMLARLPESAQFGVFEMGMNAPDEIRPLSQLVRPHVAVITNVAAAHLEKLGSLENIARAKAEIFDGVEPGGTVVLNADHPQITILLEAAAAAGIGKIVTYGFARGVDWQITEPETAADHSFATVMRGDQAYSLVLGVSGRHMLSNATAALAVSHLAGIEASVALRSLAGFGAQPGRGERLSFGPSDKPLLLIDESYNANTASMGAALDVFASIRAPDGRKVLVLGDMLELGAAAGALHAGLADAVKNSGAERVYLVGSQMAALAANLPSGIVAVHFQAVAEAVDVIIGDLAYGDAIMVKGSNGVGLSRIVAEIKSRFAQS